MIKRTPQEIADFFGCYVAQDKNGGWYAYEVIPSIDKLNQEWKNYKLGYVFSLEDSVDTPMNHVWTQLYEPCVRNTCENEDENARITQEPSTNPASLCPHQSEVHTHKEYMLIEGESTPMLQYNVNHLISEGYKLQGSPFVMNNHVYQAMVRGV